MPFFKVWSCDRSKRFCVVTECTVNDVRDNASIKLGINWTHLCLESDGTIIDSDEILEYFSKEILILLQDSESWTPANSNLCSKENLNRANSTDHGINSNNDNGDQTANMNLMIENTGSNANEQIPRINPAEIENQENNINNDNRRLDLHEEIPRIDPVVIRAENINIWSNYEYDWSNLDASFREALTKKTRINKLKTEVVRKVILQMRKICPIIPCAVLRSVAKELVKKYPDSLEDRKGEKKFGAGYINIYNSLLNRNNYETTLAKTGDTARSKCKTKNLKFTSQAKLGAVNWSVQHYLEGEDSFTVEENRKTLCEAFALIKENQGPAPPAMNEDVLEIINKTLKDQRDFFNNFDNLPSVQSLLVNWPILSLKEYLFYHYSLQMGHSIEQLTTGFLQNKGTIFAFGKAYNLSQAETCESSFEMIKIVFDYFNEDFSDFIVECPVSIYFCKHTLHTETLNFIFHF